MDEVTEQVRRAVRRGYYVVKGDSTRPSPVVPSFEASPVIPTDVDRENARRFLALRRGQLGGL